MTGITRYSNLAETTEVAATAYSYDHANRITGIVDSTPTVTTLVSYGYTYDYAIRILLSLSQVLSVPRISSEAETEGRFAGCR